MIDSTIHAWHESWCMGLEVCLVCEKRTCAYIIRFIYEFDDRLVMIWADTIIVFNEGKSKYKEGDVPTKKS